MPNVHDSTQDQLQEKAEVQEEAWDMDDGSSNMETHEICIVAQNDDEDDQPIQKLIYQSVAIRQLTPLDMTYDNDDSQYYDGTGTIVWMAALVIVPLIVSPDYRHYFVGSSQDDSRICELGCGAGVAGMAIAKFQNPATIAFTDNDPKALQLCRDNCQLNGLTVSSSNTATTTCQFEILEWVQTTDNETAQGGNTTISPFNSSFDTIVATDVLYEIIMIPPLFETAVRLLKPGGHFWLSHVPRFYLPKDQAQQAKNIDNADDDAALQLEQHIQQQAEAVGLLLVETIRPEQLCELATKVMESSYHSLEKLSEMHAVVFVFQKETTPTA